MPATATAPAQNRVGETKSFNGHTYRLNEHHRWEREDKDQPTAPQPGVSPRADKSTTGPDIDQNSGQYPAQAHAFTKTQLATVAEPVRGLMTALHAHPDSQKTGTVHTPDVAPEHASQMYAWLRQNAAAPVNGAAAAGQAVDLGGGKLGYSTPAGAIVVWPADSSGKHQIKYTNQTGIVRRAMGGQQAGQSQPAGPQTATQQGQTMSPAAAPGVVSDQNAPKAMAQERMPAGQSATPVPPPVPPPVIARPPTSLATQSQYDSMAALMDKPEPAKVPASPQPSTPREAANQAKQRLADATKQWQDEVGGGLTPKGNARWRSYTAALRSIWQQHEQLARDWEKKSQPAKGGKSSKSGGPGKSDLSGADPALQEMERKVSEYDPEAIGKIRELTQRPDSYRDLLTQYHDALFPDAAAKRGQSKPREAASRSEGEKPLFERGTGQKPSENQRAGDDPSGLKSMGSGMGSAMTDNMYDALWSKVEAGDTNEAGAPSALLQAAQAARKAGGMSSPEHLRALAKDYAGIRNQGLKGQDFQNAMRQLVSRHGGKPDEQSAMNRAGIDPTTGKQRETKSQIEARLRREAAAGIAPDVPKPVQPKPIEGSDDWKRLVKSKASEWDMKPEDFHDLASDLHRELVEHHGQRKEAYLHASRAAGLKPADINNLENSGFDSGSKHKDIKQLDTIGRDLASQYPALGWGRGREDDSTDEGDIDYASKVWDLIREGYQPPPGKHSSEFMDHVEDYLRSQLKSHGSSGTAGGNVATDDDLSSVPFAKVRDGLLIRYGKWLRLPAEKRRLLALAGRVANAPVVFVGSHGIIHSSS